MKTTCWIPFLLGFVSLIPTQAQQPQIPPLPKGPLLNNAPAFAQWLVSTTYEHVDETGAKQPKKFDSRTLVRKTGPIREQISVTANTPKTDSWFKDGWQANIIDGQKNVQVILPNSSSLGGEFIDYSKKDFFGFDWIGKRNYVGQKDVMGQKCIIFHVEPTPAPAASSGSATASDGSSPAPSAQIETGTTACIGIEKRLPVLLKEDDKTTIYEFQTPPSSILSVPPAVQDAFDQLHDSVNRALAKPGAP